MRMIQWMHQRRLSLLLASNALGAVAPRWGVAIRDIGINARVAGGTFVLSLPVSMLAVLMFTAGLVTDLRALTKTIRRPGMLLAGLTANVAFPIAFAGLLSLPLGAWPAGDEVQDLLVAPAVIGAMPIAGSSAATALSRIRPTRRMRLPHRGQSSPSSDQTRRRS